MNNDNNPYGVIPPPPLQEEVKPPMYSEVQEAELVTSSKETPTKVEEEKKEHKYKLVRGSGDPVYLVTPDRKRHWIINPILMTKLGYKFGEEDKMTPAEVSALQPGEPITFDNWEKYA